MEATVQALHACTGYNRSTETLFLFKFDTGLSETPHPTALQVLRSYASPSNGSEIINVFTQPLHSNGPVIK
jgi:hypothetical protein